MNEPRTLVSINDFTIGYGVDPVDSRLNILCPIISPAGPTELTRVTGPSMLKRLYFGGRSVKVSDHYSAVFARALVANAPVFIKRGTRNKLKGGKSSALAEPIYVDSSLNPIEGQKVTFSKPGTAVTYPAAIAALEGVVTDSSFYSGTISGTEQVLIPGTQVSNIPAKKSLTITDTASTDIFLIIGSKQYKIAAGESTLDSLVTSLCYDGLCPQIVYGDSSTPIRLEYRNGVATLGDEGVVSIAWLSDISIVPADSYTEITIGDGSGIVLDMAKIKTEEQYDSTYPVSDVTVTVLTPDTTYLFYTDSASSATADVKVGLGSGLTYFGFMQALTRQIVELFGGDTSVGDTIIIPNAVNVTSSGVLTTASEVNSVQYNDRFAVLSAFPCETNSITVSIAKNTDYVDEVYTVKAEYSSGDISESWDISFDSGVVDGYGESIYFERVNEESQLIRIASLYGENVLNQTFKIGNQISSEFCDTTEMVSALEELASTDEADVMFDYITDAGVVDSSLSSCIKTLCEKYHAYYPASVPVDVTLTESLLKSRRSQIGDYFAMNLIGETQRDSLLDSGSAIYPGSYYYLAKRIDLGNTSLEFAPLFGQSNGNINMQKPIQKFTSAVRERLLDSQVITLKREATGQYCLNLNLNCYPINSYMQEDWVALMINKINQVADVYGKSIISLPNTDSTRASVESTLTDSLSSRLRVGTEYGPASIRVQCDSSNNPDTLVRQWKIRIDIYATFANSIREVLIYSNILPLQNQ